MANDLGYWNPLFYAQEALIQLEKGLGMANRIHMGYDEEHKSFGKGDTINIRRPSVFVVNDAPSTAQELAPEGLQLVLNKWREVKFKLTDKDLTFATEKIIEDHIRPAAYQLADDIDLSCVALYKDVPHHRNVTTPGTTDVAFSDITAVRRIMFDNKVPLKDAGRLHFMVGGTMEEDMLNMSQFNTNSGGGADAIRAQTEGTIFKKLGLNFFSNQNAPTFTKGTVSVTTLAINAVSGYAIGISTINLDAVAVTGTLVAGDILTIGSRNYAVTGTFTASGNAFTGVTITPPLKAAVINDAVVTVASVSALTNLAFHRNAFAIAMAPLSEIGGRLGAQVATVQDPVTGLALRARMYYVGNSSEVHVALDALWGVKTLDPDLAVRLGN